MVNFEWGDPVIKDRDLADSQKNNVLTSASSVKSARKLAHRRYLSETGSKKLIPCLARYNDHYEGRVWILRYLVQCDSKEYLYL